MTTDRSGMPRYTLYPGVRDIASHLERVLGTAYSDVMSRIVEEWQQLGGALTPTLARQIVEDELRAWPTLAAEQYADLIDNIFYAGFMIGIADTGVRVGPDHGDQMALDWIKGNPHGFIPALRRFTEDERKFFEEVLGDAYRGVDVEGKIQRFDLDEMTERVKERADAATYAIERVVRTETAKVTALGRIAAWDNDPDKAMYFYHWVAVHDSRVKNVSLLFEREGPYEFDGIKKRWTTDHNQPWPVTDRHTGKLVYEVSAYNCRCSCARTPKPPEVLRDQGLITQAQYEAMKE